jgi:predicted MFS family arabinose efflux permease
LFLPDRNEGWGGVDMRWLILIAVFFLAVISFADKTITGLAAVPIMHDLRLNYGQWGMVGSSFYWLYSIVGIVGAAWSDRIGTGKMILIMAVIWTLSQSVTLFVAGLPLLLVSRVMLGAGEGPFFAASVSHLSRWFQPESRGFALSILNLGNTIGKAVSVPVLVFVIAKFGWKSAFVSLGVISLIFIFFWLWLGRLKPPVPVEISEPIKSKINWGFVFKLIRSPTFIFATLLAFIGYAIVTFSLVFNPAYLTEIKHVSSQTMGYMKALGGGVGALLSVGISIVSDRMYKKTNDARKARVLLTSVCVTAAGVLYFLYTLTNSVPLMILALVFENAFILMLFTICPLVVNSLHPERKGLMSGIMMGIATTSGIIGPIIFGKVIDAAPGGAGFNLNIQVMAVLLIVSSILFAIFARPDQKESGLVRQSSEQIPKTVS